MASSRLALVTGATGAIGREIAEQIAAEPGWGVIIAARDEKKGRKVMGDIQRLTDNPWLRLEIVDVSRRASIAALAARMKEPLDALVNNAAIAPRKRTETAEGIELQLATNVLGYLWMIQLFEEHLARSRRGRVVNVASYWAGDLDVDDLEFRRRPYDNDAAYRQSKQINRMLTVTDAERLTPRGISVNACHPGDVPSTLASDLGFGGSQTGEDAAKTPVWLAIDDRAAGKTGRFYEHGAEKPDRFASDRAAIERLRDRCARYG